MNGSVYRMPGSRKSPLFLIDNILSKSPADKDCPPKSVSGGYSPGSFSPPSSMMDVQFFGHAGHDGGARLLSAFPPQNPFFPAGCLPFPLFNPAGLHPQDVRNFLQNAPAFHGQYGAGFKPNPHSVLNMTGMHPYFHGPVSRPLHKRKGGQVRFSNDQTIDLEQKFKKQKYLNPAERKKLAKSLTLSERQIKTWFQNRRAKWRRSKDGEQTDCDHDIASPTAGGATGSGASSSTSSSTSVAAKVTRAELAAEEEDLDLPTQKSTNKQRVNPTAGRSTSLTSFSSPDRDDRQEMANSDSESVCSDEDDEEDVIDVQR